jgi:hypothetical protein
VSWFDFIRNDCLSCGSQTRNDRLCGSCERLEGADPAVVIPLAAEGIGAGSISVRKNIGRRAVLITLARFGCLRADGTIDTETAKRSIAKARSGE